MIIFILQRKVNVSWTRANTFYPWHQTLNDSAEIPKPILLPLDYGPSHTLPIILSPLNPHSMTFPRLSEKMNHSLMSRLSENRINCIQNNSTLLKQDTDDVSKTHGTPNLWFASGNSLSIVRKALLKTKLLYRVYLSNPGFWHHW